MFDVFGGWERGYVVFLKVLEIRLFCYSLWCLWRFNWFELGVYGYVVCSLRDDCFMLVVFRRYIIGVGSWLCGLEWGNVFCVFFV